MATIGILTQAQNALTKTNEKSVIEEVELAYASLFAEYLEATGQNANEPKIDHINETGFERELTGIGSISDYHDNAGVITFKYSSNGKNADYLMTIDASGKVSAAIVAGNIAKSNTSYVGCYIYKDGQYAIIYADLLAQQGTTLTWSSTNTSQCVFPSASAGDFKSYTVSTATITPTSTATTGGVFGPNYEITPVQGSNKKDRFLAMALSDLGNKDYYFYKNADGHQTVDTVKGNGTGGYEIGAGITNTNTLISKWDLGSGTGGYGAQTTLTNKGSLSYYDMWDDVKTEVDAGATAIHTDGWFVPSFAEWCAFAKMSWTDAGSTARTVVGSDGKKISSYGLSNYYWSSSQDDTDNSWSARFNGGCMGRSTVINSIRVRLSTTF